MNQYSKHKITCSVYDPNIPIEECRTKKVNYFPNVPKERNKKLNAISTDGFYIYDGKNLILIEEYFLINKKDKAIKIIVLTNKEKRILLPWVIRFRRRIISLEESFPIFPGLRFCLNVKASYQKLLSKINYLRKIGVKSDSLVSQFDAEMKKIIKRKIKKKTNLDHFFHFAHQPQFQEVFKFSEEREDRLILAFDFNSMFASCLEGMFADPANLNFVSFNRLLAGEELEYGVYKVLLKKPIGDFIFKYYPFKYTVQNNKVSFELEENSEIEILLYKNEIEFYKNHFESVFVYFGIVSKSSIGHPLYRKSVKLYKKRIIAKNNKNKELDNYYKFKLAMLHSITSPRRIKRVSFHNDTEAVMYLKNKFGFCESWLNDDAGINLKLIEKNNKFEVGYKPNKVHIKCRDLESNDSIHSLTGQVVATSRIKVLQLIEKLLKFKELEVCYVNTDSVHVSIPKGLKELLLSELGNLINDKMGGLKVQAITDSAYWFDVGRYFLVNNSQVVKFKNIFLNHPGNKNPFLKSHRTVGRFKSKHFEHAVEVRKSLISTLSYNKKLILKDADNQTVNYSRFKFSEVRTPAELIKSTESEEFTSQNYKLTKYHFLRNSLIY